jgi:hypothetical protein
MSTRALLRAFQITHRDGVSEDFKIDLDLLRHKDLDLSIRLGALLAFDALLINTGINPIAASPGAPLSLDAPTQPWETIVTMIGILLVAMSAAITVRAITRRLFAAFCVSVDAQAALLKRATGYTLAGGAVIGATFMWILAAKIF